MQKALGLQTLCEMEEQAPSLTTVTTPDMQQSAASSRKIEDQTPVPSVINTVNTASYEQIWASLNVKKTQSTETKDTNADTKETLEKSNDAVPPKIGQTKDTNADAKETLAKTNDTVPQEIGPKPVAKRRKLALSKEYAVAHEAAMHLMRAKQAARYANYAARHTSAVDGDSLRGSSPIDKQGLPKEIMFWRHF